MCGLVGMAGFITEPHKKMFRDMLVFDQVRGFHSTGVVSVHCNKVPEINTCVDWFKDVGAAQNLWKEDNRMFDGKGIAKGNVKVLLGHNRHATVGKITTKNAHPFQFKNVYGAHNGSLTYWKDLEDHDKFDVDSKALYNHIQKKGIDDAWQNFYGAAALTWWDDEKEMLFIARNSQRPLYVAWSASSKAIFWASESWMITAAANRNKVQLLKEKGVTVMASVPVDKVFGYKVTSTDCVLEEERDLEKKYQGYGGNKTVGFGRNISRGNTGSSTKTYTIHKNWKEGTKRFKGSLAGSVLKGMSKVYIYETGRGSKQVYRIELYKDKKITGFVEVFPTNVKEAEQLESIIANEKSGWKYKLTLRSNPRVKVTVYNSDFKTYRCSAANLIASVVSEGNVIDMYPKNTDNNPPEALNYTGKDGEPVTKSEMEKLVKEVKGVCAFCDTILDIEQSKYFKWVSKRECLCEDCAIAWNSDDAIFYGGGFYAGKKH